MKHLQLLFRFRYQPRYFEQRRLVINELGVAAREGSPRFLVPQ